MNPIARLISRRREHIAMLQRNVVPSSELAALVFHDEIECLRDIAKRLDALEKNCHEPQKIEPRVIRALLKFGLLRTYPGHDGPLWYRGTGMIEDRSIWPLIEAQVGVADDAASPPKAIGIAPLDLLEGVALDRVAALHEVDPPRKEGETDVVFRERVRVWVRTGGNPSEHHHDTTLRPGHVMRAPSGLEISHPNQSTCYKLLGHLFLDDECQICGYCRTEHEAEAVDGADISTPAKPNDFRRRLRESLSDDPDPDGFEAFIRELEEGAAPPNGIKTIPIDDFPTRPGSMVGTEPSAELMAERFRELYTRPECDLVDAAIGFARWYHGYRTSGLGKPPVRSCLDVKLCSECTNRGLRHLSRVSFCKVLPEGTLMEARAICDERYWKPITQ